MADRKNTTSTGKLLGLVRNGKAGSGAKGGLSRLLPLGCAVQEGEDRPVCAIPNVEGELRRIKGSFDAIWSNIILSKGAAPQSVLLTAASLGEGVSFVAERLAIYLASVYNLKTLYANLADETGDRAGQHQSGSLLDALSKEEGLADLTLATSVASLSVLGLYKVKGKEAQPWLLPHHNFMQNILDYAHKHFDIAVFDTQPVLMAPWTVSLAKPMDCKLLVNRFAVTRREVLGTVLDAFQAGGVDIDGVILNDRHYCVPMKLYNLLK